MTKYREIIQKINIYSVISHYVSLTKKGNNWIGLCPFHDDQNPSLSVSESKQIFKCFVCNKSGDAIKFIIEKKQLDFLPALYKACQLCQLNLSEYQFFIDQENEHAKFFALTKFLTTQYQQFLQDQRHTAVLKYLTNRNLTPKQISKYQIGYAPSLFGREVIALLIANNNQAQQIQYQMEDVAEIKLSVLDPVTAKWKDFFYDRIIFPIHNHHGQIVGYSGRSWKDDSNVKYLNSPESIIFKKQEVLYNYYQMTKHSPKFDQIYLVEGFMDVLALDQIGVSNVVASMGTAFSNYQLGLLEKYFQGRGKKIVLAFDHDQAGWEFTIKTAKTLLQQSFQLTVVNLISLNPSFKDLDQLISNFKTSQITALLNNNLHYFQWLQQKIVLQGKLDYDQIGNLIRSYLTIFFTFNHDLPQKIKVNLPTDYLISSVNYLYQLYGQLNNLTVNQIIQTKQDQLVSFIYQNNRYDHTKVTMGKKASYNKRFVTNSFSLKPPFLPPSPNLVAPFTKKDTSLSSLFQGQKVSVKVMQGIEKNLWFLFYFMVWKPDYFHQLGMLWKQQPQWQKVIQFTFNYRNPSAQKIKKLLFAILYLAPEYHFVHVGTIKEENEQLKAICKVLKQFLDQEQTDYFLNLIINQNLTPPQLTPPQALGFIVEAISLIQKQILKLEIAYWFTDLQLATVSDINNDVNKLFVMDNQIKITKKLVLDYLSTFTHKSLS